MRILKRSVEKLSTALTQEEFNVRARELAETHEAIAIEREAQKSDKAGMKQRLELLEQKRNDLMRIVQRRAEDREVDVEVHADDQRGVAEFFRMDTGSVYHEQPLTPAERQLGLALVPAPEAADPLEDLRGLEGTITFMDPDTGKPVTYTLAQLKRASKKLQAAARAAQTTH